VDTGIIKRLIWWTQAQLLLKEYAVSVWLDEIGSELGRELDSYEKANKSSGEMWGVVLCLKTPLCCFSGLWLVDLLDCRTGSLHLGPCIRALCAPHWNSFLPPSPEALRTYRRKRPLLAREGNWSEISQQPVLHRRSWDFLYGPKLGHGTDYFTSPPKEGMLRIFSDRSGSNPRTREPEASMLTARPPKPSSWPVHEQQIVEGQDISYGL
jgi:hypothetical protein